jgi:nicotinate-nucleotide pyrophosphorylase (carboxylating)
MLDNMDEPQIECALAYIPPTVETEISGGVTLENAAALVNSRRKTPTFISAGRLTHSAPASDFSMRIAKDGL